MTNATRETLATRLQLGPISVREATQISRALLSAIESAHASGRPHGAITPDTIVLENGRTVLTAAPASDGDVIETDLYAIAAVLYECISGRRWSVGADPASADWSGIPRRLKSVLRRALSIAPERRWRDPAAFQRALWAPRPQEPIWPAVVVLLCAAALIVAIVFCKPLGLCWERQVSPPPAPETR
ncbi:MAG: hypothetical protein ABR537_12645 [Gemmatimonadales bacterium]